MEGGLGEGWLWLGVEGAPGEGVGKGGSWMRRGARCRLRSIRGKDLAMMQLGEGEGGRGELMAPRQERVWGRTMHPERRTL